MKKLFLVTTFALMFAFMMIGGVSAYIQYQENADSYVDSWGGWENMSYIYDGDWNTYGGREGSHGHSGLYITYMQPPNLNYTENELRLKTVATEENATIPEICLNASDNLTLFVYSVYQAESPYSSLFISCYNSNQGEGEEDWSDIFSHSAFGNFSYRFIYEEAMIWSIQEEQNETECDYYVGDSEFNLPQITTQKSYDDSPTHKMYLACLYDSPNDGVGYEGMTSTQNCRENIETFNPTSSGDYEYNIAIAYQERQWNSTSHQWETIGSGTDNSTEYNFKVCGIPNDSEGFQSFITWILSLLCQLFGWFC